MTNKVSCELVRRKIEADPETGCWNWLGSTNGCGYGLIKVGGINSTSHRMSWVAHNGEIPKGLHVLHHCDNPKCCNPDHLYLGTHTDNMRDMINRKRRGKTGPPRKLTEAQILRIRAKGENARFLAKEFGVARSTIYKWLG